MAQADLHVTNKQLSDILDLSVRRVQQLAKEGILPPTEKRNQYRLIDCIQGYIKYLRGQVIHTDTPDDLRVLKLRQEKARAEILELQSLKDGGELQHQDDVQKVWTSIAVLIKTRLLALSSRVATDVYSSKNLVEVRARIDKEVNLILNELVDTKVDIEQHAIDPDGELAEHSSDDVGKSKATAEANS
mgnify:FL=1|tara:strand:+ start:165 stop:728 length:564 start_codon:yes stop_codon:yes gene_type:complete